LPNITAELPSITAKRAIPSQDPKASQTNPWADVGSNTISPASFALIQGGSSSFYPLVSLPDFHLICFILIAERPVRTNPTGQ